MRHLFVVRIISLMAFMVVTAAADPVALPSRPRSTLDPNQVVCEYQEILGSRLGSRKVCATRAEWAQRRQDDRATIERGQLTITSPKP